MKVSLKIENYLKVCVCLCQSLSCVRLCNPMDCSPSDSSVLGILQARVLEWVAISFSSPSSQSRDQTQVSCIAGRFFPAWATREAISIFRYCKNSVVLGEETEAHWLPTPDLYLPVQGLAHTFLLSKIGTIIYIILSLAFFS